MTPIVFMVVREDDNGQRYLIADHLNDQQSQKFVEELAAHAHKQWYRRIVYTDEIRSKVILENGIIE